MDPELNEFFDKLPSKSKKSLDAQKIRDKYLMLKQMMNKQKKTPYETSIIEGLKNTITLLVRVVVSGFLGKFFEKSVA